MSWPPNLSPWKMFFAGEWRPVTWLGNAKGDEVDRPEYASAAVLYTAHEEWTALPIMFPGDVVRSEMPQEFLLVNDEERLTKRRWPPILDRSQLTKRREQ